MSKRAIFIAEDKQRPSYGKNHPLAIPRISLTLELIKAYAGFDADELVPTRPATMNELLWFHRRDYIKSLKISNVLGRVLDKYRQQYNIGTLENPFFNHYFEIPAKATGASIQAADYLLNGIIAFNPAGGMHHAAPAQARGFCFFNDLVLGILRLRQAGLRVLYIDIDVHHGDGVESAFRQDPEVFTLSLHMDTQYGYPFRGGKIEDWGTLGNALNIPLPKKTNDAEYNYIWERAFPEVVTRFKPEAIVLQAGTDALFPDPLGKFKISTQQFLKVVASVLEYAPQLYSGIPAVMITGGGGYHSLALARCWTGLWNLIANKNLPEAIPFEGKKALENAGWELDEEEDYFPHFFVSRLDQVNEGNIREEIYSLWDKIYQQHPLWSRYSKKLRK